MPVRLKRHLFNLYPPYLGAGVRVTHIADDWRRVRVEMPLRWYNRNYVGTHFGGSLYAMADPFLMIMVMKNLGPDYVVWDRAGQIDYVAPGRGRVAIDFTLSEADLDRMRSATAGGEKYEPWFDIDVRGLDGTVVARVRKGLYIRRRRDDAERGDTAAARAPQSPEVSPAEAGTPADVVRQAFWILLWRAPSDQDVSEYVRALAAGQTIDDLAARLLASTEFRTLKDAVCGDGDPEKRTSEVAAALDRLGDAATFVGLSYRFLFAREADEEGRRVYEEALAAGQSRLWLIKELLRSDEFASRHRRICPQGGFTPRDVQLCELANPAKWHNPEWMALLRSLVAVPCDIASMHRKAYEFGQLLFGLTRLGMTRDDVRVLSVGAGHEPVLYWLANRVGLVVATDLYGGVWQSERAMEGDAGVFTDPGQFAPFPYREDRLVFLRMDGRGLAFRDAAFDVVYSLSSIEHFGGIEGARQAVGDMARVLMPGGILALATEYRLSGPPHPEVFEPAQVRALLDQRALELVEPIDEQVWQRFEASPVDLRVNPYQTPHMVVSDGGTVFTSVMAFLRKRR